MTATAADHRAQAVLAEKHPEMLADDHSDYLLAHSSGHFASFMALINRGCLRAP
ncbi:hypothetical protein ABZY09_45415 [Streptomyces sp. NPDC002928]|uniref:hypothetical protein n=1 Tax=Streptomyces sp. NPDC002928 TaxID=3154440 RepID=UPI0033A50E2B